MTLFTIQQWSIVALVFLLGLVLGMYMLAGGRWKRRYQEERDRNEALEAENARLRTEASSRSDIAVTSCPSKR